MLLRGGLANAQIFSSLALLGLASHMFFVRHRNVDRLIGKGFMPYLYVQFGLWILLSIRSDPFQSGIFLLLANAAFYIPLFASISIYRLFFHPLKSFPGPGLARLTTWWGVVKLAMGEQRYQLHHELHQQYGKIVRIAPNYLSINSQEAVAMIYGPGTKCEKSNTFYGLRDSKSLQLETELTKHRARRPAWDKALSAKRCVKYLPKLYRVTDLMIDCIAKAGSKDDRGVLVNHWLKCFVFDMVGELGYSKSYGCLDSGKIHQGLLEVEKFLATGVLLSPLPWLVRIITSLPGLPAPMQGLTDFASLSLAERKASKVESPDVLSYVFGGKKALTPEEEIEDTMMLQIAAGDTTLSALTFCMYHLAINPEIQSALRREIETHADVADLAFEAIQDLPLLESVINETLRVHPAVPSGLPRLTPPEGVYIDGTYIPGNTTVSCPTWTIQHSHENFTDPNTWNPFRWIDVLETHNTKAFIPFSVGPFNCVGKAFAYMEMKQVLARIVTTFEFQLGPEEDGTKLINESRDHTAMSCAPLYLKMKAIVGKD
ncbi:uncharacterized protein N7483_011606 [Penicillium malachiteum]|uniref:uncharacterized protein n=1 Tax=Penicillium malachiteum TaxID=1324776 RepID=UPI002546AA94|nr:uncharacterized protein N7483_011606 [Penicillium malachiteum]KAJ5714425.1 hypothetical protein N7483_011606 [Penicillium malachiteum]